MKKTFEIVPDLDYRDMALSLGPKVMYVSVGRGLFGILKTVQPGIVPDGQHIFISIEVAELLLIKEQNNEKTA